MYLRLQACSFKTCFVATFPTLVKAMVSSSSRAWISGILLNCPFILMANGRTASALWRKFSTDLQIWPSGVTSSAPGLGFSTTRAETLVNLLTRVLDLSQSSPRPPRAVKQLIASSFLKAFPEAKHCANKFQWPKMIKKTICNIALQTDFFSSSFATTPFPAQIMKNIQKYFSESARRFPKRFLNIILKSTCFNSSVCHPPCTKNIHMMRIFFEKKKLVQDICIYNAKSCATAAFAIPPAQKIFT